MAEKSKRGFAAMDKAKQREIARKGGRASRGRRRREPSMDEKLFGEEY